MYLRQPDLELWVLASLFAIEFGKDALVAPGFSAVVAIAAVFLHSDKSVRLAVGTLSIYIRQVFHRAVAVAFGLPRKPCVSVSGGLYCIFIH